MARFYFDTDDGTVADADDEGVDFPDRESAKHAAHAILAVMIGEKLPVAGHIGLRVVVRDEHGRPFYRAGLNLEGAEIPQN
jgi:hypothetical protein